MVLPEFLILFREGSWHIECCNEMFGSYQTLIGATVAAVKTARFNLANLPTRVLVEGVDGKHETVWDPEEPDVYQF